MAELQSRTKNVSLSVRASASAQHDEPPQYLSCGGNRLALHPGVSLYDLFLFFLTHIARFAHEQLIYCYNCYMEGLLYFPSPTSIALCKWFLSLICRGVY